MANLDFYEEAHEQRAADIAFSEQVLADRQESAWVSVLPPPAPAPDKPCVIESRGHNFRGGYSLYRCITHACTFADTHEPQDCPTTQARRESKENRNG